MFAKSISASLAALTRIKLTGVTALAILGLAGPAFAAPVTTVDFTGPVAPASFTVTNTGTFIGGSPTLGSAAFTTTQLVITGGNAISPAPGSDAPACSGGFFQVLGPCQIQVTRSLAGTYAFSWAYSTTDGAGPGGDPFGVIVDGIRAQLSNSAGAFNQNGTSSFTVASSFGWFINCTDCIGGAAAATVSRFSFTGAGPTAAVPEPETFALALAGLLGIGMTHLRARRRQVAA